MDLSHFDKKYFMDAYRYNCPFCNRGSVSFTINGRAKFDWTDAKPAYLYIVKCGEKACEGLSLHLSYYDFRPSQYSVAFASKPENLEDGKTFNQSELDDYFFFHQPTSFFTLDVRVARQLRELISEAENCLKMNLLVGASACIRKTIYELIDLEGTRVENSNGRTNYQDSIKAMKAKYLSIPGEYFDALGGIQELASDNVHEGSWKAWDARKIKALLELTKNVLHEMYVVPAEQKKRVGIAGQMLDAFKKDKLS